MRLDIALRAVFMAPMDDDSGLDGICGGSSDGKESDCPNMDDDSGLGGSEGEGFEGRETNSPSPYWPNGLMPRESAESAAERGELTSLPSREAFICLRETLNELDLPQPRVNKIPTLVGDLLHQVHHDENIPLNSTSEVLRGEEKLFGSTEYDYNTLYTTGYLGGMVIVWKEMRGMAPASFGKDRFDFEQYLWQIEETIHRWLSMRPGGIPDSVRFPDVNVPEDNEFFDMVRDIRRGKFNYDSDDEKVNRDSYEDEGTRRTNDNNVMNRQMVRDQASHFARNQLSELVEFLKGTKYGRDLYERFRLELTARYNRGTYPTTPIDDDILEKFLLPRKDGSAGRDI